MTKPGAPAPPNSEAPAMCPSCGSRALTTTSKNVDASTYWRCVACGEVWNVARRRGDGRRPRYGVREDDRWTLR
jgi:predicted RNA-binding Zn-ribbon protein involved in translation (DUF1610 family)